jgi:hypothetical protein
VATAEPSGRLSASVAARGREHESATKEANEIMARWMLWFGDDARIHVEGLSAGLGQLDAISPSR